MRQYNWQKPDWPHFTYSLSGLEDKLFEFAEKIGRISGILDSLPEDIQQEMLISMMLEEAIKTSEIEGEYISRTRCIVLHSQKSGAARFCFDDKRSKSRRAGSAYD